MESYSLEALVYDPSKCSKLSVEKKRELIYEVSKRSDGVSEMLKAWSRQEILQVLSSELGKERKFTGLTKSQMIELLVQIVKDKKTLGSANILDFSENGERTLKRQKKFDPFTKSSPDISDGAVFCKNLACKANMSHGDTFCKRCSCCICHKFDDNKDPSLWLICNSDLPFHGASCGMSCHLECILKIENSGISKYRLDNRLDGSFYCMSCGKVNDLLGSWRKQLVLARDTRKVDELCYRLCLGQKILAGTEHYENLYRTVDEAVQMLEGEMGPLTAVRKARGIVNRLSSGPDVQRLCASAVESFDLMLSSIVLDTPSVNDHVTNLTHSLDSYYAACNTLATKVVRFEDIRDSSLTVILNSENSDLENVMGYSLWHRKFDTSYPAEPTCKLYSANTKFLLSGLSPATQYFLKVVTFGNDRDLGYYEFQFQTTCQNLNAPNQVTNFTSHSNPSSVEDEINEDIDKRSDYNIPFHGPADKRSSGNLLGESINNVSAQGQKETTGDATNVGTIKGSGSTQIILGSPVIQIDETSTDNGSNARTMTGLECVPYINMSNPGLAISPSELENVKDSNGRNNQKENFDGSKRQNGPKAGGWSKKRRGESREDESNAIGKKDPEHYVKVIWRLEHEGHIETEFRKKFLTWYSLRATPQKVRVVNAFIDTFVEDDKSLAGQLIDTFSDIVLGKKCSVATGFCTRLWHWDS